MVVETHVVVTDEGPYGFSAESPQLPGFAYARATLSEFMTDYPAVLRDAGVVGMVHGHYQRRFATPEGAEYVVRFEEDRYRAERLALAQRVELVMQTDQRFDLVQNARVVTGEVVFVCALGADQVGSVLRQMDPRGDVLTVATAVADLGIATVQLGTGAVVTDEHPTWARLDAFGLSSSSTLSELVMRFSALPTPDRALVLG